MSVVFPLSNQFNVIFPAPPPSYSKALLDTSTPGNITGNSGAAGYGGAAMIAVFAPNTTGSLSITVGAGGAGGAGGNGYALVLQFGE